MATAKSRLGAAYAEIGDPVVVGAGQGVSYVRVFDQGKTLGKPGGVEQGLIHPHRIHVPQARLRVRGAGVHSMAGIRVQGTDVVPGHPRPPDGMPGDVRRHSIAAHLAVDLEVRVGLAVFPPQGMFAQHTVLRL